MGETKEEAAKRFAAKDRRHAERKLSGAWPAKTCLEPRCQLGACCMSFSHHVGDCCDHCGNDERDKVKFQVQGEWRKLGAIGMPDRFVEVVEAANEHDADPVFRLKASATHEHIHIGSIRRV